MCALCERATRFEEYMEAEPVEKQLSGVGHVLMGWNLEEERLVFKRLLVRG
jgi:hypothetical protein